MTVTRHDGACDKSGDGVQRTFSHQDVLQREGRYLASRPGAGGQRSLSLALSGGGLRACSQGLGVLRLLQEKEVLHRLAYISTVSGGGYCGTAWMTHINAQAANFSMPSSFTEALASPPDGKLITSQAAAKREEVLSLGLDSLVEQLEKGFHDKASGTYRPSMPYVGWKFFLQVVGIIVGMLCWVFYLSLTPIFLIMYGLVPLLYFSPLCGFTEIFKDASCGIAVKAMDRYADTAGIQTEDNIMNMLEKGGSMYYSVFDYSPAIVFISSVSAVTAAFHLASIKCASRQHRHAARQAAVLSLFNSLVRAGRHLLYLGLVTFGIIISQNNMMYMKAIGETSALYLDGFRVGQTMGDFLLCIVLAIADELFLASNDINIIVIGASSLKWLIVFLLIYLLNWDIYQMQPPRYFSDFGMTNDPILNWESSEWQQTWRAAWGTWLVSGFFLVILHAICGRSINGALGYLQQGALVRGFYNRGKDIPLVAVNSDDWPVPPLLICNATQHDLIDAAECIGVAKLPPSWNAFEMTSFSWGSPIIGWWKVPSRMSLSSAMEVSGAAMSATTGADTTFGEADSWRTELIQRLIGLAGGETGRYVTLRDDNHGVASYMRRLPEVVAAGLISGLMACEIYYIMGPMRTDAYYGIENGGHVEAIFGSNCFANMTEQNPAVVAPQGAAKLDLTQSRSGVESFSMLSGSRFTRLAEKYPDECRISTPLWPSDQPCANPLQENRTVVASCNMRWDSVVAMATTAVPICVNASCLERIRYSDVMVLGIISNPSTLQWVNWWANTTRKVWWPSPAQGKGAGQCYDATYLSVANFVQTEGMCEPFKLPAWTGYGRFNYDNSLCFLIVVIEGLLNARWHCFDDLWMAYAPISAGLILLTIVFLASAFPKARLMRWVLWSPFLMQFLRGQRRPLVVAQLMSARIPMVFLADGGHIDNTAVFPLLRRCCKLMVAVDASKGRTMTSVRRLLQLGRSKLGCHFDVPVHHDGIQDASDMITLEQYITGFEKPRARFIQGGVEAVRDAKELLARYNQCIDFLMRVSADSSDGGAGSGSEVSLDVLDRREEREPRTALWLDLPNGMRGLIHSVEQDPKDGHVYVLFECEYSLLKCTEIYPLLVGGLRICQALEITGGLSDDYFLEEAEQEAYLRRVLHIKVIYQTHQLGDILFVHGECSRRELETVRAQLAPMERLVQGWRLAPPLGIVPRGSFPSHSTGSGEGYTWPHIREYSLYSKRSAEQAWPVVERWLEEAADVEKTDTDAKNPVFEESDQGRTAHPVLHL